MTTAIVLGSTGLIGSELVRLLIDSPRHDTIVLLNRRPSGHAHAKITERIISFDTPDLVGISGDEFYCAFGTTRRKAGSAEAFQRIDCKYPTRIATLLRQQGVNRIFLVSSVGAKANDKNLYLRTKGQLEDNIIALGFTQTVIARPSLLLGHRDEFRLGEALATPLMRLLKPLMLGSLRKYRPVTGTTVARSLIEAATAHTSEIRVIPSDQMWGPGTKKRPHPI